MALENFNELGDQLNRMAQNVMDARKASFRTAERRMLPRFRDEARRAAGSDRVLSRHRSKAALDANFRQKDTPDSSFLFVNPVGPWGIRDNTDSSGKTDPHRIVPKRAKRLRFTNADGEVVYRLVVNHPGSRRGPFWGNAREESLRYIQKRIPEDVRLAIESAIAGSGYRSRA